MDAKETSPPPSKPQPKSLPTNKIKKASKKLYHIKEINCEQVPQDSSKTSKPQTTIDLQIQGSDTKIFSN
jgi:hypothetical protein